MTTKLTATEELRNLTKATIQSILNERLIDRVRNINGLNRDYANKVVTAPIASVPHTDKDHIDLAKFKKAKFRPIKFVGLTKSTDGKSLGIVDAGHGIQLYVDLINLEELQPINESRVISAMYNRMIMARHKLGIIAMHAANETLSKEFFHFIDLIDWAANPFSVKNAKIKVESLIKELNTFLPRFEGTSFLPHLKFAIAELQAAVKETH